jgi:hypothetical protein
MRYSLIVLSLPAAAGRLTVTLTPFRRSAQAGIDTRDENVADRLRQEPRSDRTSPRIG